MGPFHHFGETVVDAAAKAGIHYLDTTGEILFMDRAREKYGAAYAAKGKVLAPSTAYMYTPLEIAAHIVLETPGIDTLEAHLQRGWDADLRLDAVDLHDVRSG